MASPPSRSAPDLRRVHRSDLDAHVQREVWSDLELPRELEGVAKLREVQGHLCLRGRFPPDRSYPRQRSRPTTPSRRSSPRRRRSQEKLSVRPDALESVRVRRTGPPPRPPTTPASLEFVCTTRRVRIS